MSKSKNSNLAYVDFTKGKEVNEEIDSPQYNAKWPGALDALKSFAIVDYGDEEKLKDIFKSHPGNPFLVEWYHGLGVKYPVRQIIDSPEFIAVLRLILENLSDDEKYAACLNATEVHKIPEKEFDECGDNGVSGRYYKVNKLVAFWKSIKSAQNSRKEKKIQKKDQHKKDEESGRHFLRNYKGLNFYDVRNVHNGKPGDHILEVVSGTGGVPHTIPFNEKDSTALNKAIEKAKQWVDKAQGSGFEPVVIEKLFMLEGEVPFIEEDLMGLKIGDMITQVGIPGKNGKPTSSSRVDQWKPAIEYVGTITYKWPGNDDGVNNLAFKLPPDGVIGSKKDFYILYMILDDHELMRIDYGTSESVRLFRAAFKPAEKTKALTNTSDDSATQKLADLVKAAEKNVSIKKNKNAMLQSQLQFVKIADINSSETNHLQREKWELEGPALKELAESIRQKGVIQPIVIRPNGKKGQYFLVCGERRYQASIIAEQDQIPAFIKELTEEEAFELQITENLQRKDVHPMKEAQAYKALMDANPEKNTVPELAARFGKTSEYIAQRLSFNNLIPDMRKEFYSGKMLIGHAIHFSRLTEPDQKDCMKNCKPKYGPSVDFYEPLKTVQLYIQEKLIRKINDAIFNPNDAELYKAAGACHSCPKKSGTNELFADIKEKDRCFDGTCFAMKTAKYLVQRLEDLRTDSPELPVVGGHSADVHHIDSVVKNYLKKNQLKLLKLYTDYDETTKSEKGSVKAFAVGGDKIGQVVYIRFKEKVKPADGQPGTTNATGAHDKVAAFDEQINALKASLKKVKQDGQDKAHTAIVEKLMDLKPYVEMSDIPLNRYESACFYLHLFEQAGNKTQSAIRSILNKMNLEIDPKMSKEEQLVERMSKAPDSIKNYLVRIFINDEVYDKDAYNTLTGIAIRKAASQFKGIDIPKLEEQALVDIKKQEQSIQMKISELESKKKEAQVNAKNKSNSPAKKQAAK